MDKLISQEKIIRDLRGIKDMLVAAGDPFLASVMNRAISCVENQPEAKDICGEWNYGTRAAVCSVCGFERHLDDNFGAAIACPNCGKKMK